MLINITNLDKILLLQTLYVHADPKGYGIKQYDKGLYDGKAVEGLSIDECEAILRGDEAEEMGYLVDYYNGKPIKFGWTTSPEGQQLAHTLPYDAAHGRYRFLEALLNVFDAEEILIADKEYDPIQDRLFLAKLEPREIESKLASLLHNAIYVSGEKATFWKINSQDSNYRSSFLNGLDI